MNAPTVVTIDTLPPVCEREVLRYAGAKTADVAVLSLLQACIAEANQNISCRVCYIELPVQIAGSRIDFSAFAVDSTDLAKNLCGCERAILFAATVGIGIDRLIQRYNRFSPSKAVLLQAIGAERAEALADVFCESIAAKDQQRPRFSPGYGDVPLSLQRDIFSVLNLERSLQIYLNDSLLMTPSKSVTAFVGLTDKGSQ